MKRRTELTRIWMAGFISISEQAISFSSGIFLLIHFYSHLVVTLRDYSLHYKSPTKLSSARDTIFDCLPGGPTFQSLEPLGDMRLLRHNIASGDLQHGPIRKMEHVGQCDFLYSGAIRRGDQKVPDIGLLTFPARYFCLLSIFS